jgi:hypothetical protein
MPLANNSTWRGVKLEGGGLAPKIEEPFSFEASIRGGVNQLERATQLLRDCERPEAGGAAAQAGPRPCCSSASHEAMVDRVVAK